MLVEVSIKMLCILVLCPVLLAAGVQTLTIDSQLGTSIEDCFERVSIGEQLPSDAIYRNVSELTTRECEQICKQDKQCQSYDYGVGAKGNATCDLSNLDENQLNEKKLPLKHPDYDVYVRRIGCEQSPPSPIQPQLDEFNDGPSHRPIFRPVDQEPDYLISSDLAPYDRPKQPYGDDRPDDYSKPKPDYDVGPSYGDHRPQDIPYKPQKPDPYDELHVQDPYKPQNRPTRPSYVTEKPEYHYIIRPNRKPRPQADIGHVKPDYTMRPDSYQGVAHHASGPVGPLSKPGRPSRPNYYGQYASNYGQSQYEDNSLYLEINDPPRPAKPSRPNYDLGIYGYGTYSSQNSYSQSQSLSHYYGSSQQSGYNGQSSAGGYGSQKPGYGTTGNWIKPQKPAPGISNDDSDGVKPQKPLYGSDDEGYGSSPYKPDYGSSNDGYGSKPPKPGYGLSDNGYGSTPQKPSYGGSDDDGYGQKPQNSGYGSSTGGYSSNPLKPAYGSDDQGYGVRPQKPDFGTNNVGYGSKPYRPAYSSQSSGSYDGYRPRPQNTNSDNIGYGSKPQTPSYGLDDVGYGSRPQKPSYASTEDTGYGSKPQSPSYGDTDDFGYGSRPNKPNYASNDDASYATKPPKPSYVEPDDVGYGSRPQKPNYASGDDTGYGSKPLKPSYGDSDDVGYGSKPSYASTDDTGYGSKPQIPTYESTNDSGYGPKPQKPSYGATDDAAYGSNTQKPSYGGSGDAGYGSKPTYGSGDTGYGSKPSYGSSLDTGHESKPSYGGSHDVGYGSRPSYSDDGGYGSRPQKQKPSNDKPSYGSNQVSYGSNQDSFSQSGYNSANYGNHYYVASRPHGTGLHKPSYSDQENQGSYGQNQGGYGSTQGGYGSTQGGYGSTQGSHGSTQGGYGSTQGGYGNTGSYGGIQVSYGSSQSSQSSSQSSYGIQTTIGGSKPSYEADDQGYGSSVGSYGSSQGSYGSTVSQDYNKPSHSHRPYQTAKPLKPAYGADTEHAYKPDYANRPDYIENYGNEPSEPGYGNENLNKTGFYSVVKPVYEYETGKPNAPSYIARPGGEVVTSRPVAVGDYGGAGYGRHPAASSVYKACFRRVLAGQRALRSHVRKVVPCETLEDCRRECATEKRFPCESFNYKLDPVFRGKGLCELMTKPIEAFDLRRDFVEDKDFDFYELDRNSLEPNCLDTLRGPGALHSGFLSSKPNRVDQSSGWRDRSDWVDTRFRDRFHDDRRVSLGNRRYDDRFYVPYQINQGLARTDDEQESWGQYGGIYGGSHKYYKDRNDYHKSISHWQLASDIKRPSYGVKQHDNSNFDYSSLNSLNKIGPWSSSRYGYGSWKRGRWNSATASNSLDFDAGFKPHKPPYYEPSERRDEGTVKDCSSRRRPGMSLGTGAIRRSLIARSVVECEAACFSEREFKCVSYSYRYSSSQGSDNCFLSERPYRGLELSADSSSDVYAMPQDQGCVTINYKPWVESECFWHVRSGAAVSDSAVRAALTVAGLGACEAECIRAHAFFCRGFSFRFDSPTIGDELENCILTSSPPTSLVAGRGLRANGAHELYARGNYGRGCEPALYDDAQHRDEECYLQYDKAAKLIGPAIHGQARVKDEQSCGHACTEAPFRCLSFSYNNNAPPDTDNCLLSEIRLFDLQKGVDYEHSVNDWLFAFDLFNGQCWRKVHQHSDYDEPSEEIPRPLHALPEIDHYSASGPSGPSGPGYLPDKPETYILASPPSGPSYPSGPDTFKPGYSPPSRPDHKPGYPPAQRPSYPAEHGPEYPSHYPEPSGPEFNTGYPSGPTGPDFKPAHSPVSPGPNLRPGYPAPGYPASPFKPGYPNSDFSPGHIEPEYPPGSNFKPQYPSRPNFKPQYPSDPNYKPEYPTGSSGPDYRPGQQPGHYKPSYRPDSVRPSDPIRPDPIGPQRPGYRPTAPGYPGGPGAPGYLPDRRPGYPGGSPGISGGRPGFPNRGGDETTSVSWQHYTVSGFPCRTGTACAQNHVAGHWACEPEGGEIGSWDYCCAPSHRCGYSEGFHKPWCYVGPNEDQWRPCSEKYYPYHQHNVPHPSSQGHAGTSSRPRPWQDRPEFNRDRPQGPYLSDADRRYWDNLYKNGPQAYYDKFGNPLPGYSRVPTAERPQIKYKHNYPRPGSGQWLPVDQRQGEPDLPGALGAPRYWPVAYLHKGPPPNMTYFRYNETEPTTTTEPSPQSTQQPTTSQPKTIDFTERSHRDEKKRNISDYDEATEVTTTFKSITTTFRTTTTDLPEVTEEPTRENTTKLEFTKVEKIPKDKIEGIDDKLVDFDRSIEVLDLDDVKGDKIADLKTLEAEERQIEEIGRILASRRGGKLVLDKRSQKDLESKNIAIDQDLVDFNFGNRFNIERRGVIQKVSKDDIERGRVDKSLEVSETTFVRPPRVLSTTENIRKAIVNGKVFYDATIREPRDIFVTNSTRKTKSLRPMEEFKIPSLVTSNNFGKKIVKPRNVNPVRRVRRVYRKRYNPEEVRRRLLEREKLKQGNSTESSRKN